MRVSKLHNLENHRGIFRVTKKVPEDLRPHLPPPYTGNVWLRRSTGTGNRQEANRRALPILAEFAEILDTAKAEVRPMVRQNFFLPGTPHFPFGRMHTRYVPADQLDAPMIDVTPAPLPAPAVVTFAQLIEGWKAENHPRLSSIEGTEFAFRKLSAFFREKDRPEPEKADNAALVASDDLISFKVHLLTTPTKRNTLPSQNSVKKHLALIKAVYAVAELNKVITPNPCLDAKITVRRADSHKVRFNRADLRKITGAASGHGNPVIRWGIPLALYTGCRLEDIADATTADFSRYAIEAGYESVGPSLDGRLVLRVDQGKTDDARRRFPLHRAIIDAGFSAYLDSLPAGSSLFPNVTERERVIDGVAYKSRKPNVGSQLNGFLDDIGIAVAAHKTFHSFRHTYKTIARHYIPREDVSDYLTGSANEKSESRKYGDYPIAILVPAVDQIPSDVREWPLD